MTEQALKSIVDAQAELRRKRHAFIIRQALQDLSNNDVLRIASAVTHAAMYARDQLATAEESSAKNLDDLRTEFHAWLSLDKRLNGLTNL